jgi:hypothetical protein
VAGEEWVKEKTCLAGEGLVRYGRANMTLRETRISGHMVSGRVLIQISKSAPE